MALSVAISRLNGKSFSDDGDMLVSTMVMCVCGVAIGVWALPSVQKDILPHKRRLEALLKEFR